MPYARNMSRRKQLHSSSRWRNVAALTAAMLFGIVAVVAAQESTTARMGCTAARDLVTRQGAIVLRTSPTTYDRYVATRAYCMSTEVTEPAFVPSADARDCFVGYTCREPQGDPF
jgi:hypothetical protein